MGNSLGEIFISLGFDVDDEKLKRFKDNLKDTQQQMAHLGKTAAESLGILGAVGSGIGLFVQHSADGAVKLGAMAQAWNANTQAAQTFGNAMHQLYSQIGAAQGQEMYGRFARLINAGIPFGSAEASNIALLGGDYKAGMSVEQVLDNFAKNYDRVKKQLGPQYGAQIEKVLGSPFAELAISERAHNPQAYLAASKYNTTDQTLRELSKFAHVTAEMDEAMHKFADSMAGEVGEKLVTVVKFLTESVNYIGEFNSQHPGAAVGEFAVGSAFGLGATGLAAKKFLGMFKGAGGGGAAAGAGAAAYDAEAAWLAATGGGAAIGSGFLGRLGLAGAQAKVFGDIALDMQSGHTGYKNLDRLFAKKNSGALASASAFTDEQRLGILRALMDESGAGLDPTSVGDSGQAYGIAQWHPDRQANFERWAGHSIRGSSREEQLAFVNYELTQGMEKSAGDKIKQAKNSDEAYLATKKYYERPAGSQNIVINVHSNATDNDQVAQIVYDKFQQSQLNTAASQTNLGY